MSQPDTREARPTTCAYSVMMRVGEMLDGKASARPVACSTTQNDPPRTGNYRHRRGRQLNGLVQGLVWTVNAPRRHITGERYHCLAIRC